jgi:predicted DNA-binding antitoxin AbrB/MazE fold protein
MGRYFAGEMMEIQAVRARYANQALWLEQPLEIPEGAQVQVFIQVQSDEPLSSEEQKRRLEAWLGAIRGISVSLDAIRRETIYED